MRARDVRIISEQETIALLASDAPGELLQTTLAAAGWDLLSWRPGPVHHRPGAGVTGVFSIEVRRSGPSGRAPGTSVPTHACITSSAIPQPGNRVSSFSRRGAGALSVWVHPDDPQLPGLPLALDPVRVTPFAFGRGHAADATVLDLRSYRPLRRAVVLAVNGSDRRYLKVLRARTAGPLVERHRMLRAAGVPAPVLAGDPLQDVVAMHPAPGTPLAELLMRTGAADVDPHALVRVLTALPAAVLSLSERPPWAARVRDYAEGAVAALPSEADRIRRIAKGIDHAVRSTDAGPLVPTHGDFYEGNLLMTDGAVSGLLDVDALGPGHLVDDLACFLGHIAVLPGLHAGYEHVPQALLRFLQAFDQHVDPAALRSRAAAVSLTLIAGARRQAVSEGGVIEALSRLDVAEQFLVEARILGAGR
ncbi:aminoglycoside phosphotransferase [Arthrobacter agilis]|uniref:Aminoglycoside phosphotransferase n=1 Tax=Arthrobacter agilis TaxID=37921 RepID=A0A2L0UEJ8_9MICC|nr:phosphotransferase [Arthrobacter agilis]AUZ87636.1 aminoglycoside phosphotransferase [Arthrobacter agilis]